MPVELLSFPTGAALYDSDRVRSHALATMLRDGLSRCSTPLAGTAGREGVRLIRNAQDHTWVWRHNRRGGWLGRWVRDSYVWLGAARTRAFREWRLLRRMLELGLPVPTPIAAVYRRHGLVYRSDLITELLPAAESLAARLTRGPVDLPLWEAVGTCIRRFHQHGIYHADLNAHNILFSRDDRVYLIDFDRGAFRRPGAWQEANWARLHRSLEKVTRTLPPGRYGPAEWTALRLSRGAPAQQPA